MFIQLLPTVVQSFACFDRIQDFCNYGSRPASPNERDRTSIPQSGSVIGLDQLRSNAAQEQEGLSQTHVVSFKGDSFGWTKEKTVLHNLNVNIPRNTVTVVVGSVGSGKSSFLSAVLGDLISTSSTAKEATENNSERTPMAYCSQTPWLENGTIRQNILGVTSYEQKWYDVVTSACGLDADLQALQKGDYTLVGSKGVNLSGGQKQRIVSDNNNFR